MWGTEEADRKSQIVSRYIIMGEQEQHSVSYNGLDTFHIRMTDRLRRVLLETQNSCRNLDQLYVHPDHLWLGLLNADRGVGLTVLRNYGVDLDDLKLAINTHTPRGINYCRPLPQWTSTCLEIFVNALKRDEDTRQPGYGGYVGTEHLVAALLEVPGIGTEWLRSQGWTADLFWADFVSWQKTNLSE